MRIFRSIYSCVVDIFSFSLTVSVFGVNVGLWQLLAFLSAPWSLSRLAIMVYLFATSLHNIGHYDKLKRLSAVSGVNNGDLNNGSCYITTSNGINLNSNRCHYTTNGTLTNDNLNKGITRHGATTLNCEKYN